MKNRKIFLWDTISERLCRVHSENYIDIRYVSSYFDIYPHVFPKFMLRNNYTIAFNTDKLRYEISKCK